MNSSNQVQCIEVNSNGCIYLEKVVIEIVNAAIIYTQAAQK